MSTELQDQNFDSLAQRFQRRIAQTRKGELRLRLVWEDMLRHLPQLDAGPALDIWDAGGGLGQISLLAAARGHRVLLSDPSAEMLALARENMADAGDAITGRIELYRAPIQSMTAQAKRFDVVVCHAVLEWLGQPQHTLAQLVQSMRPGAYLSLMFYNINSLIYTNLHKGNFKKLVAEQYRGDEGGLTPLHPLQPADVANWLRSWNVELVAGRGIRVVHDLLRRELREARSVEDIIAMENRFADQEPFASLGRYYHIVGRIR